MQPKGCSTNTSALRRDIEPDHRPRGQCRVYALPFDLHIIQWLAAVLREDAKALMLFALNRSLDEAMPLEVVASGFGTLRLRAARQLMQVSPASPRRTGL